VKYGNKLAFLFLAALFVWIFGFEVWAFIVVFISLCVIGLNATRRRNNDPIYHELLEKLFAEAEISDDIYDRDIAMKTFINEICRIIDLDGPQKARTKLAHLATMVPYYGFNSDIVKSRAVLICDRVARNYGI
tara:strand:+ start:25 stop:423 length:399 start_codon:yes stop_codon:yes gene_type:complete